MYRLLQWSPCSLSACGCTVDFLGDILFPRFVFAVSGSWLEPQDRISKVQVRIQGTEAKIAAAERDAAFYRRVVSFVRDNQPDDKSHMAHLDKVGTAPYSHAP